MGKYKKHTNSVLCYYFQKCMWVGEGGGGVNMLHNTLHEQIYRAKRLFMFYRRILNLVGCARYYVCVVVDGGGGGDDGCKKCSCSIPSIPYTRNRIRDRINPDGCHIIC